MNLAPALRAPLHLSNLNSITSPIIVEAVGVIPCLLRSSCEVDRVTYQYEPCCRHSYPQRLSICKSKCLEYSRKDAIYVAVVSVVLGYCTESYCYSKTGLTS